MKEIITISVGGSLIVPDKVDFLFLKKFKKLIERQNQRFIIVCGGGKTARNYQSALKKINNEKDALDWIGIESSFLNARLIQLIFEKISHKKIIRDPQEKINFKEKVLISCGWKPGRSTDYNTIILAKRFQSKKVLNLSNIEYIYDKDPNKYESAKKIKEISWQDFRKLLPEKWEPGLNSPFDPVASKKAEKLKLEVNIIKGQKIKEIENCLNNKKFKGSKII